MTTVAAWYLYAFIVTLLLTGAAAAGETALRSMGRQGRWAWLVAMLLSVGLPVLSWAGLNLRTVSSVPEGMAITLAPVVVEVSRGGGPALTVDGALISVWVLGSFGLVALLVLSWLTLRRERRTWRPDMVDGVPVMVSRRAGPAVYGLRYPDIVLPEWALGLESRIRRLMLSHEREHVRAGDTRLLGLGLLLVAAAPWNAGLWVQFRRLRQAVELDCDRRVLRQLPDARLYGSLLIEVGQRRSMPMLGVALAEPTGFLERRIRHITSRAKRVAAHRVFSLVTMAVLLASTAVLMREPIPASGEEPIEMAAVFRPRLLEIPPMHADTPPPVGTFTPYTVAPRILNPDEVGRALQRNYPPLLRDAGIGGEATVWFYIAASGDVVRMVLDQESGYPALDDAALRVGEVIEFSPAMNGNRRVAVWVSMPFQFIPARAVGAGPEPERPERTAEAARRMEQAEREGRIRERSEAEKRRLTEVLKAQEEELKPERQPATLQELRGEPRQTPYTLAPRIVNMQEVGRALELNYPPLLRDAGIGGEVSVWFLVSETGRVERFQLNQGSGYPALDEAALRVATTLRFSAAELNGQPVPVWVSLPIKFATR